MQIKKLDRIIGLFFAISTVVLIYMFFTNREFFTWAFSRHQNILSWYIRPLFIIPIVIGAYKQSFSILFMSIFGLFTSMFWFPKPEAVDEQVHLFLEFEKNYLTIGWTTEKIFVCTLILLFFIFMIYTTWNRKWGQLLWVVIAGAVLKVVHSILSSGENGMALVKPAATGLVICIVIIVFIKNKKEKKLGKPFVEGVFPMLYPEPESNRHAFRRWILSPVRLPVPPSGLLNKSFAKI